MFLVMMIVEQVLFLLKDGRFNMRASDFVTSISAGIFHALPKYFSNTFEE
jgi:hypothetical protein